MKVSVQHVTTRTGMGVQTITGITDRNGQRFVGKLAFALSVGAEWNTLRYQTGANVTGSVWNWGADDGTNGCGAAFGDIDQFFAKIVSTGDLRRYSIGDYQPDIFFGGNWQGYGYVSAFRLGELDITYDLNNRGGQGLLLVVLGGDDLQVTTVQGLANGVYATTGTPVAVLSLSGTYPMSPLPLATTGAGGRQMTVGWDTVDGQRGMAAVQMINQGGNARGTCTDRIFSAISGASFVGAPVVSAWGVNDYTISGGLIAGVNRFAFAGVQQFATNVPLRTTPGPQVISTGIAARWVMLASPGTTADGVVDTTQTQLCVGWSDGLSQGSAWFGESASGTPIQAARYLSDDVVLQITDLPATAATVFDTIVRVVDVNVFTGDITLDVVQTSGQPMTLLVFVLGDPVVPDTTNPICLVPLPAAVLSR